VKLRSVDQLFGFGRESSGSGGLSRYDAGVGANVPSGRGSPVNLDGALVVVAQVNKLLDIPTQPRYPAIVDLASRVATLVDPPDASGCGAS